MSSKAITGSVYPGGSLPLRGSSMPDGTIGLESSSRFCDISSGDFLASFFIFFTTSTVAGGLTALVWLRYFDFLPYDDVSALLVIVLLVLIDLPVLVLFFSLRKKLSPRSSRFIILASCVDLLFFITPALFSWSVVHGIIA